MDSGLYSYGGTLDGTPINSPNRWFSLFLSNRLTTKKSPSPKIRLLALCPDCAPSLRVNNRHQIKTSVAHFVYHRRNSSWGTSTETCLRNHPDPGWQVINSIGNSTLQRSLCHTHGFFLCHSYRLYPPAVGAWLWLCSAWAATADDGEYG